MTKLHLISMPLDMSGFHRWAAQRGLALDEGRALHHLLSESFGKGALRPFRLMVAPGGADGTLYAYATADESVLRQTAYECGLPEALAVCDPAQLAGKIMPMTWTSGRRLAFDLRVRPIRRLSKPAGIFSAGAEVDAFLADALRESSDGRSKIGVVNREQVYLNWLAERLEGAAKVEVARVVRCLRVKTLRGKRVQEGPDVTFHGELTVLDSNNFSERLGKGIGRHGAYGYGMLLLRPAIKKAC
jgi:CRISPR system Cascade subunit CasE